MSNTAKQMRPLSATHRAVEQIRQLIFDGELRADSNHLESELAERLGISRTPVREATLTLQAQGLLKVQPRKGVRINSVSISDMEEVYVVLIEMECLAVRIAAKTCYDTDHLGALDSCIVAMQEAVRNNDRMGWAHADEQFNLNLVQLARNDRMVTVVRTFNDQVRRARSITLKLHRLPEVLSPAYRLVYNAILTGNSVEAVNTHRQHRDAARRLSIQLLEQSGLERV